jgi:prepilin-type N-terminal cleavage/methylation domain-containing protein
MRPIVKSKRPSGFTLIELAVVIFIIGILLAFVLVASAAAAESARVRATQALIAKLTVGLEERMEAVLATQIASNGAHNYLASINPPGFPAGVNPLPWGLIGADQRAAVLARLDQIRQEFPDVFFINPAALSGNNKGLYPIRFAGVPYPNPADATDPEQTHSAYANYVLPLGNTVGPAYIPNPGGPVANVGPGDLNPLTVPAGTGINGASYAAAAALYKLIGYTAKGYDGIDNDNNGFVDEYNEGTSDPQDNSGLNLEAAFKVNTFLLNHTHKTARSEMLYAILVEGLGPFGSVFSREDFRDTELKDTDNDGVPEFVDGWGEPLQFYRWPFGYRSGLQKGEALYNSASEPRQTNPLDQNNQLTAIAWWSSNDPTNIGTPSAKCMLVQQYFGPLADPNWISGTPNPFLMWDRSGATGRRAYLTKFLIVSGGPDRQVGIPRMGDIQIRNPSLTCQQITQSINGSTSFAGTSGFTFVPGESWATGLPWSDTGDIAGAQSQLPGWAPIPYEPYLDQNYALDDLTNQDLQNQAGGFK